MKEERRKAVSETVGAIVLVAIAMLVMAILALVFFSNPLPTRVPSFASFISNNSRTIYISHEGGDPLLWGQYKILVDNVDETWNFTRSLDANRTFSLGMVMNATLPRMAKRVVVIFNTSWGSGTMLLSADLTKTQVRVPYGWFSPDWSYRKKIVIDHTKVPSDQYYFPVLYYKVDPDLTGSKARSDGNDILFTDSTGMTQLSHEIEYFDHNSGTLWAWVKVPNVSSSSDTIIYMYYGNSGASNQQSPAAVWDSNFKGVWHLKEDPSGSAPQMKDSTSGANHGTSQGFMTSSDLVAAQVDGGLDFDGSNDYLSTGYVQNGVTAYTIEAWVNTSTASTQMVLVGDRGSGAGKSLTLSIGTTYPGGPGTAGDLAYGVDSNSIYIGIYSTSTVNNNQWHHVAGTWTAPGGTAIAPGQFSLYIDGSPAPTNTASTGSTTSPLTGLSGTQIAYHQAWNKYFQGKLDEVRISNSVRSAAWIATEYNNQNSPGTFVSVGSQQTPGTMN